MISPLFQEIFQLVNSHGTLYVHFIFNKKKKLKD